MYSVSDETRKPIFEGVQGENESREIQFDISSWIEELGEGACTATAKRPTDTIPYPVTVTRSGNVVTWKPNSTDTAIEGIGAFQLEYSINGSIAKTRIWNTKIAPSLDPAGDPPDPYDNWLAEMRQIAADALQDAQDAEGSADAAAASAASVAGVTSEVENIRIGADGTTYANAGDAVRGQVTDLKSDLNYIDNNIRFNSLATYLYKKDTRINGSLVEEAKVGFNLYKIPCVAGDFVQLSWTSSTAPYDENATATAMTWENSEGTLARGLTSKNYLLSNGAKEIMFIAPQTCKYVYFCVKQSQLSDVTIERNCPYESFKGDDYKNNFVFPINAKSAIKSYCYIDTTGMTTLVNDTYSIWWLPVKSGDVVKFASVSVSGLSFVATFIDSTNTAVRITTSEYTFADDGILCVFDLTASVGNATLFPINAFKVDASNVIGLPQDLESVWDTLSENGKKLKVVAGAIRNDGNGWAFISDTNHNPINLTSISVITVSGLKCINVNYGFTAKKVVSLVICPDETFANQYRVGGSVGLSSAYFQISQLPKSYGGMVILSGNSVTKSYSNFTGASFNTSTGEIKLNHPNVSSAGITEIFNVTAMTNSTDYRVIYGSQGNDFVSLYLVDANGDILKDNTGGEVRIGVNRYVNEHYVDADTVSNASGNFWIFGVMEVE